ncbi:MAG TPA: mechanosensitive ion channel domain-containing protein, partial [Planctomycetota bacterium]|nr:mechanosensitive ion channel domain-containing protein [Planctomycetota bacterium]
LAVVAVDVPRRVLVAVGYGSANPGFVELLSRVEQGLLVAAVVLLFARKVVLEELMPHGEGPLGALVRTIVLRLRPVALAFAIAVFAVSLLGYRFLAGWLESISLGGTAILVGASLAWRATTQLWQRAAPRLPLGPQGSDVARERRELLGSIVRLGALAIIVFAAYRSFAALSRVGAEELRDLDVGVLGGRRFTAADILAFVLTIAATFVLAGWTRRLLWLFALPLTRLDLGTRYAVALTSSYVIVAIGLVLSLTILGLDLGNLGILLGAAGFGIGLGMQDSASNLLSGLVLLFARPVRVGDVVDLDGRVGEIVEISMGRTRIVTPEGHELLVPNRDLVGKRVVNLTGRSPAVRVPIAVGVAYGSDAEQVKRVLLEVAKRESLVRPAPPAEVAFIGFGQHTLDFELRLWTHVNSRLDLDARVRYAIVEALREAGITMPLPQREISVKGAVPLSE